MYPSGGLSFTFSPLLTFSSFSAADDIGTYVSVECPVLLNSSAANCIVANQTFTSVGIVDYTVPVTEGGLDISCTVGIADHILESDQYRREAERVLYIGTSPDVDLLSKDLDYAGCGFYITLPDNNNVVFEPNRTDPLSPASCDVLGNQCILNLGTDLVSSAIQLASNSIEGPSNQATTCSSTASSVQSNFPSSCTITSPQIHGLPLTGASAAKPISSSGNTTSNCHPTIPRSNQLTRVASHRISASAYYNKTAPTMLGETPVMSLSWKQDGTDGSLTQRPCVNFQCLFASAMTTVGINTMVNNGTDDETGGTGERLGSGFGMVSTVALAAFIFVSGIV